MYMYWLKEMMLTFVVSLIFNILALLISKQKIDFVKVLMATLVTSLISVVYKITIMRFSDVFDPDHRYEVSLKSLILSPLLLAIITNVGQLLLNKKKLSLKNIIVDTSNSVRNLSSLNLLSELDEIN